MAGQIFSDRLAPDADQEFVVFLIGMRVNKWWQLRKWLHTARAMPRMIKELQANPALGLKHVYGVRAGRNFISVQYWESFEHLRDYANNPDHEHKPAWAEFYKVVGLKGDVGIWHETYAIKPGQYEAIYGNMPKFGLGTFLPVEKATGRYGDAISRMKGTAAQEAAE